MANKIIKQSIGLSIKYISNNLSSDSNELLAASGQPDYTNWNMMDWAAAHNGLDVNNQVTKFLFNFCSY